MIESKKIGRYEILEEKGHGAMGAVFVARDPAMDRVVALKTIHSLALNGPQAAEFRERFYREARSAGGLAHPGIVTVFDVGEQDGVPYLVMEFIEGRTLADASKNGERFTLERVAEIGQQIADALGYAHKHGVIHRDVKPANVLLTSVEKYGIERPKITDFGIAKLGADHLTTTGQVLGTPAFMPPEQFTGAPIDGRSDIFSLGTILYWMATGEHAFPGETMTAVSYKVVHTAPVEPRKLNPALPAALDQIIMRCLAKAPAERYGSGEDLAHDLQALRNGQPLAQSQSLQVVAPVPAKPAGVLDATADSDPSATTMKTRNPASIVFAFLIAGIIVAAGWYGYTRRHHLTALVEPDPSRAPVVEPLANEAAPRANRNAARPNRNPTADAPPKNAGSKSPAPTSATPALALPRPPMVAFDPHKLDPETNGKLKIDAEKFPPNVNFTVEMNGRVYFERGTNSVLDFEDLYVPPGVPEFRVIAGDGTNRKTSNIVSAEFKAKKKKILKVELRSQGQKENSGMPAGVYADSQIVVTLK